MKKCPVLLIMGLLFSFNGASGFPGHGNGKKPISKERVLVLSPAPDNKRNSEGAFITLKDGRILFVYTHYEGAGSGDHDAAHLAGRFSSDGGKTWTPDDDIILMNEGKMNIMSVSLLRLQNGKIALFYLRKNSPVDCIPLMRISSDEAKTWSPPVPCITDKQGYFVLNNDRVIQLKDGRLLIPVALHQVPGQKRMNSKGKLFCYYSDDCGATWTSGTAVPDTTDTVTQEPGLIELNNGTIMMFIRASGGYQQLSCSGDRGETWSHIVPGTIHSPLSPASIKRVPATKDLLLVWNNNDGSDPSIRGKRTPLTAAISEDEGNSWQNISCIEPDPDGWYCYTAIHFTRKHVLLSYCGGSQSAGTHLAVDVITRIKIRELYRKNYQNR